MTTHVSVVIGGSTRGLSVRAQRIELRRLERLALVRDLDQDERARLSVLRERDRHRTWRNRRERPAKRQSAADQIAEMIALEALQRERGLTHAESERLGELVMLEQKRAYYRPARIARLRAELALLESLEMAQRGAVAERCAEGDAVELRRADDGSWSAERHAA